MGLHQERGPHTPPSPSPAGPGHLPPQHTEKKPVGSLSRETTPPAIPPPELPVPVVSLGGRVSRMLSSQGRMLTRRWSSSSSPSIFVPQAAALGGDPGLVCSEGGTRKPHSSGDKLRPCRGPLQMPTKGVGNQAPGELGRPGSLLTHPPTERRAGKATGRRPVASQVRGEAGIHEDRRSLPGRKKGGALKPERCEFGWLWLDHPLAVWAPQPHEGA